MSDPIPQADAGTLPPLETVTPAQAILVMGDPSEVDTRAVAAASAPASTAAKPAAAGAGGPAVVDRKGQPFNPALHECTLDGAPLKTLEGMPASDVARLVPVINRDGKCRLRSYALPEHRQKSRVVDPSTPPEAPAPGEPVPAGAVPPTPPPAAPPASDAEIRATAATFAALQLMLMRSALGPHVGTDKEQGEAMVSAWESVARHYGVGFTHPVLGLALVTGGVVLAAMQDKDHGPEVSGKLVGLWHRVRHWAYGLWIRARHGRHHTPMREVREEPPADAPAPRSVAAGYAWPPV